VGMRRVALAPFLSVLVPLLAIGCSGDEIANDGASASESESETGEEPKPLGGPARGISIVEVEANQGTAVRLTEGDVFIGPADRNAYLVSERDTLVRFQHVVDDAAVWIPRELTGLLHIYPPDYPDGADEIVRERRLFVGASSDPRDLSTNFYFSLLSAEAQVGTRFWLELRESDGDLDVSGLGEGVSVAPVEPQPVGFEPVTQTMKVVFVPVDYQWVDPPRLAAPTAADIQLFHDDLLQHNPVQTVEITVRDEPMVWDQQLTNLGDLLGPTRAIKEADQAPANVYYHALVENGGPSVNMVAGIALLTNASMEDSDRRVAATVFYKQVNEGDEEMGEEDVIFPPTGTSRTIVHEIGHNQGLSHVYCPGGDAAGPDPAYPYDDGKIGVYGFGIRNYHMYTPSAAHDYMSYCGNSWVSDWTWNKTYDRIRTLTSWDEAAPPAPNPTHPVLVGMLFADGSESWWVYEGSLPDERSGTQALEFWRDGELLARELAEVTTMSDGETLVLTAPLPPAGLEVDAIVHVDQQAGRRNVEIDGIRVGRTFAESNRVRVAQARAARARVGP
jgi:hypothetical protein